MGNFFRNYSPPFLKCFSQPRDSLALIAVQWASMIYEVTPAETSVRYVVCHDANAELVFKVTVVSIGADARVSSMREELA